MSEGFARTLLKNGNLNGILVSKGEFWIEVKDDNGYSERYLAPWRGLGPTRGGGLFSLSIVLRSLSLVIVFQRNGVGMDIYGYMRSK